MKLNIATQEQFEMDFSHILDDQENYPSYDVDFDREDVIARLGDSGFMSQEPTRRTLD